jgi:primosomal protein N' (replication factor Y) (superfamily II helicase)
MARASKTAASGPSLFGPIDGPPGGPPGAPPKPKRRTKKPPAPRKPRDPKRAKARPPGPPEPPTITSGTFADVALNRPVDCEFTYRVPEAMVPHAAMGMRVAVPFGMLREVGVVTGFRTETEIPAAKLKSLMRLLDAEPLIGPELIELARWIAERYACSFGEALHAMLPGALKRERERVRTTLVWAHPHVGDAELAQIAEKHPKQHRLLRTLLEVGAPMELRDLTRRLNLSFIPARTLAKRGWVTIERVPAAPDPLLVSKSDRPRPKSLLPEQQAAVDALSGQLERGEHATFLLEGITGSGKTEVYLAAIERALALGRGAIVLVPEIALTPQTVGWFRARFEQVAVLHSHMSDSQRLDMWLRVKNGEARVVVGARSAVFAPVPDLGVVVLDEEHEPSFKQNNVPRYQTREVAIERARIAKAVCVLGSATPSLESWHRAKHGEFRHLKLTRRISGRPRPPVEIVDLRTQPVHVLQSQKQAGRGMKLFSARLMYLLTKCLERKEQAILFQNRRGFAPVLWCGGCKETVRCKNCDVTLTWHQRIQRLVCHSCCEEKPKPANCPTCTAPMLRYLGAGSERIEHELRAFLPAARVRRMDSDTMRRREDYERTLSAFGNREIDVLVGTQMIAKGLDFPHVTLVGIIDADTALHLPDFRAAERTFQLIAQVAGRAGRGEAEGRILVQTLTPDHPAIRHAAQHDFEGFAKGEDVLRAELGYPPHGRLVRVLFEDRDEEKVLEGSKKCAEFLEKEFAALNIQILGPAPAPTAMLRGRHRHHLLLKSLPAPDDLQRAMPVLRKLSTEFTRPHVLIDVDPAAML